MLKFKLSVLIALAILFLSSLRGGFILLSGLPPSRLVFFAITIINIVLIVLYSKFFKFLENPIGLTKFLNLIIINIALGVIWLTIEIYLVGFNLFKIRTFLMFFITPLSVLLFIRIKEGYIISAIYFIAMIVALSCIFDFWISNIYPGGIIGPEIKKSYLATITPEGNRLIMSRIGILVRAHGITGSYHDSAHILTMSSVFIIGYSFYHKNKTLKVLSVIVILIILLGLITTMSTANIIAAIFGIVFINFFSYRGLIKRLIIISVIGFIVYNIFQNELNLFGIMSPDLNPSGVKMQAMMNMGDSDMLERFSSIIFGHERTTRFSNMGYYSEAAIVVMLMEVGLFTFIPMVCLMLLPIYYYYSSAKEIRKDFWVPVVTVMVGLLTLWHYGSLHRSTSIFLFYAFYAMAIKGYITKSSEYMKNSESNKIITN